MDREPENRRDMAPAQAAPNPLGGETFTVTTTSTGKDWEGKPKRIVDVRHGVPFGSDKGVPLIVPPFSIGWIPKGSPSW